MNTATQLRLQAYLDNELSPREARELARILSTDPQARELYNELKATRDALRANEPLVSMPESREFFWSKIQRDIQFAEAAPPRRRAGSWWLRLVAPMAGAVALFAILLSLVTPDKPGVPIAESANLQPLHEVEDLAGDVSSITFRSESEGVTVVWVSSQ